MKFPKEIKVVEEDDGGQSYLMVCDMDTLGGGERVAVYRKVSEYVVKVDKILVPVEEADGR